MMSAPDIQLEDLLDLQEELRNAGFDPGLQRVIASHNLLLALAAQGRLPADPSAWRTWLAPVFCSTPSEQEEFYLRYDGWVKRHVVLAAQAKEAAEAKAVDSKLATREIAWNSAFRQSLARLKPARLKAGLRILLRWLASPQVRVPAALALFALLGWIWLQRQTALTLQGQVFTENESQPLDKAIVEFGGRTSETNAEGRFEFTYQARNLDRLWQEWLGREERAETLTISHSEHFQRSMDIPLYHPKTQKIVLGKRKKGRVSGGTLALSSLPSSARFKIWEVALILSPFLSYTIWLLWTLLRRRALLQRLPNKKLPQLHDLKVEGIERKLFAAPRIRQLLLGLRRPLPLPMRELNVPATVRATIQQGGAFMPAYGERRSSPEYLLLIDRASAQDEQANVADELRLRLAENGVFVDPYYFQGDARSCRSAVKDEAAVSLQQLAGRYPNHRLLVFSDGAGFFEPFTGNPQRWLEQFTPWKQRVLLTPEAPVHWGYRERELAIREFVLLPASDSGIKDLGEWLNYGLVPSPETPMAQPFPASIEERPHRWLERQAPLPDEVEELATQVEAYLGQDGWSWLCACAVYPQVTWVLTLYHGYWLFGGDDKWREAWAEGVLRLVRLPWFRYGTMPDWWRERLVGNLQGKKEATVRRGIERLLRSALAQPSDPITLEYAVSEDPSLWAHLREMWSRWQLYRGLQTVESEEPLRDYVFLRFLAGQRLNRLSVIVPNLLRRLLFIEGQWPLGFHPVKMFAVAVLASLTLLLSMPSPPATLTFVTTPISFNSEELIGPNEYAVRDFSIHRPQSVTINIFAECQNCFDKSLYIYVLDEDNYRKFEGGEFYDAIGYVVAHSSYMFSDRLDRGRYYIVLQNASSQEITVKIIKASLSHEPDNQSY